MATDIETYIVVIERAEDGSFGAYVPDLPGCIAAGDTRDEVETLIREAFPCTSIRSESMANPSLTPARP